MNLIIFTGAPASGKSSLAEKCSLELKIPWYSKDNYKIMLFKKYGFTSHSEKKELSIRGEKMLLSTVHNYYLKGKDVIIDNNFKNFDDLRNTITGGKYDCNIICIYLYADSELLAKRYNERISSGNREICLYSLNQYPVINGITEFHKPLTSHQVDNIQKNVTEETFGNYIIRINTTNLESNPYDIQYNVIKFINENIRR